MITGNAGMPTPYTQGFDAAADGDEYYNPYDQPGEEGKTAYEDGYNNSKMLVKRLTENTL